MGGKCQIHHNDAIVCSKSMFSFRQNSLTYFEKTYLKIQTVANI